MNDANERSQGENAPRAEKKKRLPHAPRLTLEVTQEIIDAAVPRDSGHCVIADAVKAAYPTAKRIAVDLQTIRFTDPKKGLRYTFLTPRIGQLTIIKFDQGVRPEPFTTRLRNGQVTIGGSARSQTKKPLTEGQLAQRRRASAASRAKLGKARLRSGGPEASTVPDRIGGKTPPVAPGRRRAFGLRALER